MRRYTIVKVEGNKVMEYGKKYAILSCKVKEISNGIYAARVYDKYVDKNGKKRSVVGKFRKIEGKINLEEQHQLYLGLNPKIAKKYLFKPFDYGYRKITKEQRNAILKCDRINAHGMTDIYKYLHQTYLYYLYESLVKDTTEIWY